LLLDISSKETNEDVALINKYRNKKTILLFNKTDLPQKMDIQKIKHLAPDLPELKISALKRINIDKLKDMVHGTFVRGEQKEGEIILHLRQKLLLEDVQKALSQGLQVLNDDFHEEMFVEEIRSTLPIIGQLTGEIRTDDILNDIFSRFCIGK
jgi:tRNA modification GTPase